MVYRRIIVEHKIMLIEKWMTKAVADLGPDASDNEITKLRQQFIHKVNNAIGFDSRYSVGEDEKSLTSASIAEMLKELDRAEKALKQIDELNSIRAQQAIPGLLEDVNAMNTAAEAMEELTKELGQAMNLLGTDEYDAVIAEFKQNCPNGIHFMKQEEINNIDTTEWDKPKRDAFNRYVMAMHNLLPPLEEVTAYKSEKGAFRVVNKSRQQVMVEERDDIIEYGTTLRLTRTNLANMRAFLTNYKDCIDKFDAACTHKSLYTKSELVKDTHKIAVAAKGFMEGLSHGAALCLTKLRLITEDDKEATIYAAILAPILVTIAIIMTFVCGICGIVDAIQLDNLKTGIDDDALKEKLETLSNSTKALSKLKINLDEGKSIV